MAARSREEVAAAPDPRRRVVIEALSPELDGGRYPVKRVPGEDVIVEADIYADGHDAVSAVLRYRREDAGEWLETPFEHLVNDRWRASFRVDDVGTYVYTAAGWIDRFKTWQRDLKKRVQAGQDIQNDLDIGSRLVDEAASRAASEEAAGKLRTSAARLRDPAQDAEERAAFGLTDDLGHLVGSFPDLASAVAYSRELHVVVDPPRARFSTWYEMFPRSCTDQPERHGTLRDCVERLEYVRSMGFDVLYLPPVHPIGTTARKGKNNSEVGQPDDVGSPWAIGSAEGGHDAIHPALGTVLDFVHLVQRASELGIAIAIDLAFQCSPDHPYVAAHPEWFRKRQDGSIQYAENPPKKYEDIYPFDFECEDREGLYRELKRVVLCWIERGVRIFRVDNPHTKPFSFWERLIGELRAEFPDLIFLSEAFTRPKVMYRLARIGFNQSYTYFAWRTTKREITEYFTELSQGPVREYFRPCLWPNTPDILTEYLQTGGRPAFAIRLILAATLGASYGIYGPAFELQESRPREPGSEEYLDSEKYQLRIWDLDRKDSLRELISRVNRARRENPALQSDGSLRFHETDNDQVICYLKRDEARDNAVLVIVNLDPYRTHSSWVQVDTGAIGVEPDELYQVHDLLTDARYLWHGARNYVLLDPRVLPAHVFRIRRRARSERDFDYFM